MNSTGSPAARDDELGVRRHDVGNHERARVDGADAGVRHRHAIPLHAAGNLPRIDGAVDGIGQHVDIFRDAQRGQRRQHDEAAGARMRHDAFGAFDARDRADQPPGGAPAGTTYAYS